MARERQLGNRALESCVGSHTEPLYKRPRQTWGTCRYCEKTIKLTQDGVLRTHGKMVGAIWQPSTGEFRYV